MAVTPDKVFGITGWKNSGKTTLVEALIRELTGRGYRISTIKHAHHAFNIDVPGKDSYRHREAGAHEVIVASDQRWALMHEIHDDTPPTLVDLLSHFGDCDLLLVEGFKGDDHPKIEVLRALGTKGRIADSDSSICAVATPDAVLAGRHRRLDLDDISAIADFICVHCGMFHPA